MDILHKSAIYARVIGAAVAAFTLWPSSISEEEKGGKSYLGACLGWSSVITCWNALPRGHKKPGSGLQTHTRAQTNKHTPICYDDTVIFFYFPPAREQTPHTHLINCEQSSCCVVHKDATWPRNSARRNSWCGVVLDMMPWSPDAVQDAAILENPQQLVVCGDLVEIGPLFVGKEEVGFPDGVQHGRIQIQGVVGVFAVSQARVIPFLP